MLLNLPKPKIHLVLMRIYGHLNNFSFSSFFFLELLSEIATFNI